MSFLFLALTNTDDIYGGFVFIVEQISYSFEFHACEKIWSPNYYLHKQKLKESRMDPKPMNIIKKLRLT